MSRTACLTRDELTAFQLGNLPEAELEALAAHLDGCPTCEAAAEALDSLTDPELAPYRETARARPLRQREALPTAVGGHEILEEIGRGGMGVVFKARHLRLGRTVALKMLLAGIFADGAERRRFRAEAAAVAQLHHPHIVQVYEVGEHDDRTGVPRPYFTLEFLDGGSLADRVRGPTAQGTEDTHPNGSAAAAPTSLSPVSPRQAAAWLEPLARAVHYAHTQGVIHRDLKPSNVLLTREGLPKICDFGIAKRLGPELAEDVRTRSGMLVGTVEYMPPEQAAGAAAGPAADVYSLGAILYALLTGRPPYQADSVLETLMRLRNEEPVAPSRRRPGVPPDLETICLKCLEKDAARRYASAEALADDLRRFRTGEPVLARPVGAVERAAKWARRRPAVAGLLAAVAAVTLVGLGLVAWQWREAVYQRGLADENAAGEAQARRLAQEREAREKQARREAERLLAGAILEQGAALCDRGEVGQGLLWQARALGLALQAGDADLQRVARINLSAWQSRLFDPSTPLTHEGWVWTVAFSLDGRLAASAGRDSTARLWDAATGKPHGEPLRHDHPVWALAFSPDGKLLLTGSSGDNSKENQARLWDVATGRPLGSPLLGKGTMRAVGFSPDGRSFLTAGMGEVRLWRLEKAEGRRQKAEGRGQEAEGGQAPADCLLPSAFCLLPDPGPVLSAAFSPDGKYVVTCGTDGTARLWEAATGKPHGQPLRHRGPVEVAAFSPDSRTLATGGAMPLKEGRTGKIPPGGEVRLWRVATGEAVGEPLPCAGWVRALTFGADGRTLAAGTLRLTSEYVQGKDSALGGEVRLWQAPAEEGGPWSLATGPLEHPRPVRAVAFSPDGRLLLTGAEDACTRLYQAATGNLLHGPLSGDGSVTAAVFRPDGRAALTGASGGTTDVSGRLWRLFPAPGPRRLGAHKGTVDTLVFAPDNRRFVTAGADGVVQLWDAATGKPCGVPLRHSAPVSAAVFSPDGKTLLTASEDKTARLWEVASGRPRGAFTHAEAVSRVAFSPDGKVLALGEGGNLPGTYRLHLREAATGAPLGTPLPCDGRPSLVAFSPDRSLVLAASPWRIRCWRLADRQAVDALWFQPRRVETPAAFSPDGKTLAVASEGTIRLVDYASGRELRRWPFPEPLQALQFSPDGKTLVLSFSDYSAQPWDVALARPRSAPLFHRGGKIRAMAFSRDSRTVVTGWEDGRARLWDAATGKPLGPPLLHPTGVTATAFYPDGRTLLTGCADGTVLSWPVPGEEPGPAEAVRLRMEERTRLRLDDRGIIGPASTADERK
jgi:WD40 repeat protein